MKIAYAGLGLQDGKHKYDDIILVNLAEKFQPAKVSPYYFEFLNEKFESADAIAISKESILDLLIPDLEKIEGRISRTNDSTEKKVLERCLDHLENQKPVCDLILDKTEQAIVNSLNPFSSKPTVMLDNTIRDTNVISLAVIKKSKMMFFYTVGKQEVHAWLVEKGTDAVTCAGKIHSDIARGFIKAEIVSYDDLMTAHNMQDARSKDLVKIVGREYTIPENTILEIRFKV